MAGKIDGTRYDNRMISIREDEFSPDRGTDRQSSGSPRDGDRATLPRGPFCSTPRSEDKMTNWWLYPSTVMVGKDTGLEFTR